MARVWPFSQHCAELLLTPPVSGDTHRWLARVASSLRRDLTRDKCFEFLRECCSAFVSHRRIPDREVEAAVAFAYDSAPAGAPVRKRLVDWPALDLAAVEAVTRDAVPLFDGMTDAGVTAQEALEFLFKPGELVCACWKCEVPFIKPLAGWLPTCATAQFVCVNPMAGLTGETKDGKPSVRCQSNIAFRRWLVAEFDSPAMDRACQARVASVLARGMPLRLAVDSGGKSLHCWFYCEGVEEREAARFFALACALGADRTRWDPCGWLRMPGGTRYKADGSSVRQKVVYFTGGGKA